MSTAVPQGGHSQTSLSPANSQTRSIAEDDIPLGSLVAHLLASKRSLSSITTVWRANEIVTSARSTVEESAILDARTRFLLKGISFQVKIIQKVRNGMESVYKEGQRDFEEVIQSLDAADMRLQKTMDILRLTIVEAAFRPEGEEPRSLLDFVDQAGVETMRTALKESIDQSQEAQAEFFDSIQSYDLDLKRMRSVMSSSTDAPRSSTDSPIPKLLHSLESNAAEMASLLDSLVRHFDRCVNAIKHTEGGFAAVKQAANDNQLPDGVTVSGVIQDAGSDSGLVPEPLSAEDRKQMLTILSNDAAEVEDVVAELHQYLTTMEEQFEQIQDHVASVSSAYASTTAAFALLESIGAHLPVYMASSQEFLFRWADSKAQIEEQMDELEGIRVFYEGYLSSYDGLIVEVSRRHATEEKMKALLRKTMEQVQKLHEADTKEREGFRREVGDFLPSDLWPGLVANAPRFEIDVIGDENGGTSIPELEKAVVDAAAKREKDRRR